MKKLHLACLTGLCFGSFPLTMLGQVFLTDELLTNPGGETGNLTGWAAVLGGGNTMPSVDNGTYDPGINPHNGTYDFVGDTYPGVGGAQGYLQQRVDVSSLSGTTTALIDQNAVAASVSFYEQSLSQSNSFSDYAHVSLSFYDVSLQLLGTASTANALSLGSWTQTQATIMLPAGTRSIVCTMDFYRGSNGGTYIDSFIDDNSLRLIAVPEPAAVTAAAGVALLAFSFWRRLSIAGRRPEAA